MPWWSANISVSQTVYINARIFSLDFQPLNKLPIVGIYKSLRNTWTWKLGLRPRTSFTNGIICFKFAVFAVHSEVRTNHGQWYHSLDDLIWLVCPFNFILIVKTLWNSLACSQSKILLKWLSHKMNIFQIPIFLCLRWWSFEESMLPFSWKT